MSKTLETLFALVTSSRVGATLGDPRPAFVVGSDGAAVRFLNAAAARRPASPMPTRCSGKALPLDAAIVRHVARFARNAAPGRQSVEMVRFFDGMKPALHQCILIHLGTLVGETSVLVILANPPRLIGATDFAASLDLIAADDRLLAAFDACRVKCWPPRATTAFSTARRTKSNASWWRPARRRSRAAATGRREGPAEAVVVRVGGEAGLRILSIGRVAALEDEAGAGEPGTVAGGEAKTASGTVAPEVAVPETPAPHAGSETPDGAEPPVAGATQRVPPARPLPSQLGALRSLERRLLRHRRRLLLGPVAALHPGGRGSLARPTTTVRPRRRTQGAGAATAAMEPVEVADADAPQAAAESRAAAIVGALEPIVPAPPFPGARPEDLARIVEIVTQQGRGGDAAAPAAAAADEPTAVTAAEERVVEEASEPSGSRPGRAAARHGTRSCCAAVSGPPQGCCAAVSGSQGRCAAVCA